MKLRTLATTLTIGSFFVIASTGICLLLHIRNPLVKPFHEVFSIIFIASSILHIIVNRASIKTYIKNAKCKVTLILFILFTILAILPLSSETNRRSRGFIMNQSFQLLVNLNAQELAIVTHKKTVDVLDIWESEGLSTTDSTSSLKVLASKEKKDPATILGKCLNINH